MSPRRTTLRSSRVRGFPLRCCTVSSLAFVVVLLSGGPAVACSSLIGCPITIDDFEEGVVDISSTNHVSQTGLSVQSCFTEKREIHVGVSAPPISVTNPPLFGTNKALVVDASSYAYVNLTYRDDLVHDLSEEYQNDRFLIEMATAARVEKFEIVLTTLVDPGGKLLDIDPARLTSGGTVTIAFSEFPGVDFTLITSVHFRFTFEPSLGLDHLAIHRIRVAGPVSHPLIWQVPVAVQSGPPWPLPGPDVLTMRDVAGNPIPSAQIASAVNLALNLETGAFVPVQMTTSDGADGDPPSPQLNWEIALPSVEESGRPDVLLEFVLFPLGQWSQDPVELEIPPTPNQPVDEVLYVPFEAWFQNGPGPLEILAHSLRFEVAHEEGYAIESAELFAPPPGAGNWGVGLRVELRHTLVGAPSSKTTTTLARLRLEGDWAQEDISTSIPTEASGASLRLSASPSVMSYSTRFHWSRALTQPATLTIYDARGRRIRGVSVAPGSSTVAWDGRDASGKRVASGVYLVQLSSSRVTARERVVVVR